MIEFIGWTLVNAGWEGGIIAAALAAMLWLSRRAAASTRYVIALVALALTVAAPIATTIATSRSMRELVTSAGQPAASAPAPASPRAVAGGASGPVGDNAPDPKDQSSLAQLVGDRIHGALPWLVAAWLVGIALLSIRMLAGVANVWRLGRRGVSVADAHLRSLADAVATRLGIRSAIRVIQSTHVDVPMVIGWLRPAVIVPVSLLASVAPAQLEMLLAHELAHIRRYDTIVNLVQSIVEVVLFFHPAVWWISARVRDERENCCDDLAIAASGDDRHAYGAMLLTLEEARTTAVLAVAATDGSLLRRVRRIVLGSDTRLDLGPTWFAGVATMLTVLFVAVPTGTHAAAARAPEPAITQPAISIINKPSPKAPMPRSTLLVGAAALTVAAAQITAQTPPNFSGRWVLVADSASDAPAWHPTPEDSLPAQTFVIEQNERTMTVTIAQDGAKMGFKVDGSDAASLTVSGPMSISFNIKGVDVSLDADDAKSRLRAQWQTKSGSSGDISTSVTKLELNIGRLTFSFGAGGDLFVQTEISADNQPAKRSFQRFRRA